MSETIKTGGIGLPAILTIVFVILKVVKVIDWSWVWVLSPIWISYLLYFVVFAIFSGVAVLIAFIHEKNK